MSANQLFFQSEKMKQAYEAEIKALNAMIEYLRYLDFNKIDYARSNSHLASVLEAIINIIHSCAIDMNNVEMEKSATYWLGVLQEIKSDWFSLMNYKTVIEAVFGQLSYSESEIKPFGYKKLLMPPGVK